MSSRYRWYAQSLNGTWLHRDLPINGGSITWGLSGGDSCAPSISPSLPELYDTAGNMLLPTWGCYLYAEINDQIVWGGILNDPEYTDPALTLNGIGFTDYAQGFIYNGDPYIRTDADPLDVFRDLWAYIQTRGNDDPSLPNGVTSNLGLVVDPTSSSARIGNLKGAGMVIDVPQLSTVSGEPLEQFANVGSDNQLWKFSALDGQGYMTITNKHSGLNIGIASAAQSAAIIQHTADGLDSQLWKVINDGGFVVIQNKQTGMVINVKQQSVTERAPLIQFPAVGADNERWIISDPDTSGYSTIASVNTGTVTPYELDWWNSTDLGQELTNLAQQAPADFAVQCSWTDSSKQAVTKRLVLTTPRIGTNRKNLRFAQGENISRVVTLSNRGTVYGNEVIYLGAGAGSEMLRAEMANNDGRLLRRLAVTDQSLTSLQAVTAAARKTLAASQGLDEVQSLTVTDHPHAPIGSFGVGDDIPVTFTAAGKIRTIMHRITSYTEDLTSATADLTLNRSDSFSYLPVDSTGSGGGSTFVPGLT